MSHLNSFRDNNKCDKLIHPVEVIRSKEWTYKAAADKFQVSEQTIWRWLTNKSKPHKRAFNDARELVNS